MPENNNKKRIFKYDLIRAIAILSVLGAHIFTSFASSPNEVIIKEYINTIFRFAVTLFIFLAGFFFHDDKSFSYLKQKIIRVMTPYTFVSIFAITLLIIRYSWKISDWPKTVLSFILGYGYGYYFIPLIIMIYILGYLFVRWNLFKKKWTLLMLATIAQLTWMAIDEWIYHTFNFYNIHLYQFRLNDLLFYRLPIAWILFFALGIWYKSKENQQLVKRYKRWIWLSLGAVFLINNIQIFYKIGDYTPHGSIIWSVLCSFLALALVTIDYEPKDGLFKKAVVYLSKKSYSIFLVHYFFIYFIFMYQKNHSIDIPYWAVLIVYPYVLFASILVVEAIRKLTGKYSYILIGS